MSKGTSHTGISIVYFCLDGKGNILMAKRSANARDEHGRWDSGGGGLEFGDDVIGRLKTEIKEEYNADILEYKFLGYRDVHREHEGKPTHWVALDFKVLVDPMQVKNNEPHKFDSVEWFPLDRLPEPLHSQVGIAIETYRDRLLL